MQLHLDHDFVLNPDGTGKVTVRWTGPAAGEGPDPSEFMRSEISQAKGVETWQSVSCGPNDEGRLIFEGTAYFKTLGDLRFHCQGFHLNLLDFVVSQDDKGEVVVETAPLTENLTKMSDADAQASLSSVREKIGQGRAFVEDLFGGLTAAVTLRLPGKLGAVKNAKRVAENAVRAEFAGKDLLGIMDRLLEDDALLTRMLREAGDGPEALAYLLGDKGPVRVTTKGGARPQFDFEAEAAAAREAFGAQAATLDLPRPPERGAPMTGIRVVAVKIVREADSDRDLTPMGQSYPSLSWAIAGDLPAPAFAIDEGVLEAAVADSGEDLAPQDDWKRRIHFPKLMKGGGSAWFEVEFSLPGPDVAGFREVRGFLRCQSASGTRDVDLGFSKLAAGSEGKELGARIERFEPQDDDRTTLELRLQVAIDRIVHVALLDDKGGATPLNRQGYSASGDECVQTFEIEGKLPRKPRLGARVIADVKTVEVPFAVENADLLGRPRT